jgi:transporter family protein
MRLPGFLPMKPGSEGISSNGRAAVGGQAGARLSFRRALEYAEGRVSGMVWLTYGLVSVFLWGGWGFASKLALRHVHWVWVSLFYGIGILIVFGGLLFALKGRDTSVSWNGLWTGALVGVFGTAGLVTFYLALDRGKASVVIPLIGIYPIITAVLSVLFLNERLTAVQVAGIGLAAVAVVLISLGR